MTEYVFQMVGALLFVLFLIFALSYFLKMKRSVTKNMSVIEYLSVGPKKGIAAIKVGKMVLIIGVTQTEIRLLKSLDISEFKQEDFRETLNAESTIVEETG